MILWIDPGIRKLWYALIKPNMEIVEAGILKLDLEAKNKEWKRLEQYQRMVDIQEYFTQFFKTHKKITTVCMEKYFFMEKNKNNAEFVFGTRWILLSMATKLDKEIKEYTPIQLKKNITWNGKANKQTMQKVIAKIFKLQNIPEYDDAADALGLALMWISKNL